MRTIWAVAANRTGARFFVYRGAQSGLELIEMLENPEGRLQDHELESDRHSDTRPGANGHSGFERHEGAREHAVRVFAGNIAHRLDVGRMERQFDGLLLVAEPRFLGTLQDALDSKTRKMVRRTASKDLQHVDDADVLGFVRDEAASAAMGPV